MRAITTHQYLWETVPLLFLLAFIDFSSFFLFSTAAPNQIHLSPAFFSREAKHRSCLT